MRERWRAEVGACEALAANGDVAIAATDTELLAFGASGGDLWWTIPIDGGSDVALVIRDGVVHYAADTSELAVDVKEGQEIDPPPPWPEPEAGGGGGGVDGPELDVDADEGGIAATDAGSGLQRWWVPLDDDYVAAIGIAGAFVLVNGGKGLHVLAADNGSTVALVEAEGAWTEPSPDIPAAHGRAFAGLTDGWLVCLEVSGP